VAPILIVGLGNPGDTYAPTRHNVGFRVIDALTATLKSRAVRSNGEYLLRAAHGGVAAVLLMKPLTFMNNSGFAVAEVLDRYGLSIHQMLVVVDDFALPLGKIRLRSAGSDGGHNGLFSIAFTLQTTAFPRLRCGIAVPEMPAKKQMADFVLSPFSGNEVKAADRMINAAAEVALTFAREGLSAAVQRCSL